MQVNRGGKAVCGVVPVAATYSAGVVGCGKAVCGVVPVAATYNAGVVGCGKAVCGVVPVAAIYSAGVVAWRMSCRHYRRYRGATTANTIMAIPR